MGCLMDAFVACWLLVTLAASRASSTRASPLVSLDIYYETMCPDSVDFIVQQLHPTLQRIGAIINVSMIPYGIASERWEGDHYVFSCQHGAKECRGNLIQTCAIYLLTLTDPALPLKFIYCMQRSRDPSTSGPACATEVGVTFDQIASCAAGKLGNRLQHIMAQKTQALTNPRLNWVPWIVLDGVHTDEIQRKGSTNLLKLICAAYKGPKPSGC